MHRLHQHPGTGHRRRRSRRGAPARRAGDGFVLHAAPGTHRAPARERRPRWTSSAATRWPCCGRWRWSTWRDGVGSSRSAERLRRPCLAHQALAQALQFYGVRRDQVLRSPQRPDPSPRSPGRLRAPAGPHGQIGILHAADGLLVLGNEGEKRYGRQNFLDLYSVFETPEEVTSHLTTDRRVIGTLQTWFVQQVRRGGGVRLPPGRPRLAGAAPGSGAGRDDRRARAQGRHPSLGWRWPAARPRDRRRRCGSCCWRVTTIHSSPSGPRRVWTPCATNGASYSGSDALPIRQEGREWTLYTFAGDRINILLGRALALVLDCQVSGDSLTLKDKAALGSRLKKVTSAKALETIRQPDFFTAERVMTMVQALPRGRLSKFQPLLPPDLEARFLAERLFDLAGLQAFLMTVWERHTSMQLNEQTLYDSSGEQT